MKVKFLVIIFVSPAHTAFAATLICLSRISLPQVPSELLVTKLPALLKLSSAKTTGTTPNLIERIDILKQQIASQIKAKHQSSGLIPPIDVFDSSSDQSVEYVEVNGPITPIMDYDERKISELYKLRRLKTTTGVTRAPVIRPLDDAKPRKRARSKTESVQRKPQEEVFYRRSYKKEMRFTPLNWVHCQVLVTPFLSGIVTNVSNVEIMPYDDHYVDRLIYLLKINTTSYNQEEIYSLLYQISNIQIRLFQWTTDALKLFLNFVIPEGKTHSFRTLKYGIKNIFSKWKLDISNTTNLLKQARVFRPPCFGADYEGSTESPKKDLRYKVTTTRNPRCDREQRSDVDDPECRDY